VAWITPQHQAGSVAYLWCVVQRFPSVNVLAAAPNFLLKDMHAAEVRVAEKSADRSALRLAS
ncbi:hypothetical protein VDR81_21060, partial [Xanthomonas campestris pv. campestris]|nr:hypothetical protein [Xanthomonas campestris pv. campestris]